MYVRPLIVMPSTANRRHLLRNRRDTALRIPRRLGHPSVTVAVDLQVDLLVEGLAAVRAQERLEVGVDADVGLEVGGAVERLATHGADVRFEAGVGEAVSGQVAWLTERSPAYVTRERLLSSVDSLEGLTRHMSQNGMCEVNKAKGVRYKHMLGKALF